MARRAGKATVATVGRPDGVIPVLNTDEWLDALGFSSDTPGYTVQEISDATKIGARSLYRALEKLVASGDCIRTHAPRRNITGSLVRKPVYQLKEGVNLR